MFYLDSGTQTIFESDTVNVFQKWVFYHALLKTSSKSQYHVKSLKAQYLGLLFISGNVHHKQVHKNMKYVGGFLYIFVLCFTGGDHQSSLTLFCTFLSFLCFICKHFVKMYILGRLFLYAIGMLYNALMYKLSVLYFLNCLVVIAEQCIGGNKFRLNSSVFCGYH